MKSKKVIINVVFAVVLLAIAGVLFLLTGNRKEGGVAELTYGDDNTVMLIPLNEDKQYDIDTGYLSIHLKVENGQIAFVNSSCPDHQCEGFGWLSREDDWAACLPAHASLIVLSGNN